MSTAQTHPIRNKNWHRNKSGVYVTTYSKARKNQTDPWKRDLPLLSASVGRDGVARFWFGRLTIGKVAAIKMLLGDVKSQDVAFITMNPALAGFFGLDRGFNTKASAVNEPEWPELAV